MVSSFQGVLAASTETHVPEAALSIDTAASDDVVIDRASLSMLYGEIAPRVHRFLRDLLGDPALAADATQETFIRAFRRIDEVPRGTRLGAWVFGIARHVSLEMRRARSRARRVVDDREPSSADVADVARSPEAACLDREALTVVARALDLLTEDRRAVLLLRLDHGLSYEEIAALMTWSLPKVKVEIHRAREVLRTVLADYQGGVT